MSEAQLHLLRDSAVVRVISVGDEPISMGRDLGNTVCLLDDDVSIHHAVVSYAPGGLEVRDLHSTNGTFVNGARVEGRATLKDADELRLGAGVHFRACMTATTDRPTLMLEHITAGTAYLIDDERYRIGSDRKCGLRLPDGPAVAGTLIAHANGEVWLGTTEEERPLEHGVDFTLGDHTFRVIPAPVKRPSTVWGCREARYGYRLRLGTDPASGLHARLHDPASGAEHQVTAENRVALLITLGKRLAMDLESGKPANESGWTHDEDVLIAVWGRAGFRNAASTYSVLLHRLRKEVENAGFDPWFIEKRRGAIRLRLHRVSIDDKLG